MFPLMAGLLEMRTERRPEPLSVAGMARLTDALRVAPAPPFIVTVPDGRIVSRTVTLAVSIAVWLPLSDAVHATRVVPRGSVVPMAGLQLTPGVPSSAS